MTRQTFVIQGTIPIPVRQMDNVLADDVMRPVRQNFPMEDPVMKRVIVLQETVLEERVVRVLRVPPGKLVLREIVRGKILIPFLLLVRGRDMHIFLSLQEPIPNVVETMEQPMISKVQKTRWDVAVMEHKQEKTTDVQVFSNGVLMDIIMP